MNSQKITASWEGLSEEAVKTTKYNLSTAIKAIDDQLGSGYAKEHPELIGAFLNSAATIEQGTTVAVMVQNLQESIERIGSSISDVAISLENR